MFDLLIKITMMMIMMMVIAKMIMTDDYDHHGRDDKVDPLLHVASPPIPWDGAAPVRNSRKHLRSLAVLLSTCSHE